MDTYVPIVSQALLPAEVLPRLRQALTLLASIRNLTAPPTSADGLKQSLALVFELAQLVGLDPQWIDRAQQLVNDPAVFNILLAVVQYLAQLAARSQSPATNVNASALDAQSLADWLPLLFEVLHALLNLRGAP
jgi:hypothetical protein